MKEIVLDKKKKTVSIDEIDNSSIVGFRCSTFKNMVVPVVTRGEKIKFRAISFSWTGIDFSDNYDNKTYKSIKKIVGTMLLRGHSCYLFNTKRGLFEWGLEDL